MWAVPDSSRPAGAKAAGMATGNQRTGKYVSPIQTLTHIWRPRNLKFAMLQHL